MVKKVKKDDLEIEWKNFSLEQVNSKEGPDWKVWEQPDVTERRSLLAQIAAEASRKQGDDAHAKFHLALLIARHGGESRMPLNDIDTLIALAEKTGLDGARLREDMMDPDLPKKIGREHEEARAEGIFGTPTFVFENGTSS